MLILTHSFRSFSPWPVGNIALVPLGMQYIMCACMTLETYSPHVVWEANAFKVILPVI
jgi:hypothetical protein